MDVPLRALVLGLGWAVGWCLLWRVRGLPDAQPSHDVGVSVVIPARDEARRLPALLAALATQTQPATEIVVVDDGSTDGTAGVAREHGARVITGEQLPPGWAGKAWAMWQGANATHGTAIVFLDADTVPRPSLLARVTACLARNGGLVSVQPYHRMQRWWERAAAFFNVVAVMGVGMASLRPRVTGAFGPCLACSRADFLVRADDPHVRGAVVEDVALARRFAADGLPLTTLGGRDAIDFRMYERPRNLVEGFAKNIASGAGSTPPMRLLLIVAWITACLAAVGGLWRADWVGLAIFAAFVVQLLVMLRPLGSFSILTAVLYPLAALTFVAVFLWSLALSARGEVRWKGRVIRLRGS